MRDNFSVFLFRCFSVILKSYYFSFLWYSLTYTFCLLSSRDEENNLERVVLHSLQKRPLGMDFPQRSHFNKPLFSLVINLPSCNRTMILSVGIPVPSLISVIVALWCSSKYCWICLIISSSWAIQSGQRSREMRAKTFPH